MTKPKGKDTDCIFHLTCKTDLPCLVCDSFESIKDNIRREYETSLFDD